ncbi:DUF2934 domain-containing protein [Caballeronia sp. LZ025]|uniref:DUF2934 domain-containing protein n=1 Tax=Caballeronia TaxID=1827195 RepID=UPI001FD1241F|nr:MULTISPECIES: DUF2934 domain-containing protein [Caballeronia]MDR5735944.1 DUF2934 domain-containing protein [Caballeronia sp. LZ025]
MSVTFKEEEVRERAYYLWESEGRCEGRDDHYWHLAIELLEQQARTASPAAREGQVANSTIAAPDKSSALADAKPGIECRQQASAAGDAQKA